MVRSNLPDDWQDLATGYVLGDLTEDERSQWDALVQEHPDLAQEIASLESAFHLFGEVLPQQDPPPQLLQKIKAAAHDFRPSSAEGDRSVLSSDPFQRSASTSQSPAIAEGPAPRAALQVASDASARRWRWIAGVGGAIAATTIAALGFQLGALQGQLAQSKAQIQTLERDLQQAKAQDETLRPILNSLQEPDTLIYSLSGSELAGSASGSLVVGDPQSVTILVKNLPELPSGKVYRLWADLPAQPNLTYCGQFNSNADGIIRLTPTTGSCGANPRQMIITVDAVTDPTTRGGPVVMQGAI